MACYISRRIQWTKSAVLHVYSNSADRCVGWHVTARRRLVEGAYSKYCRWVGSSKDRFAPQRGYSDAYVIYHPGPAFVQF